MHKIFNLEKSKIFFSILLNNKIKKILKLFIVKNKGCLLKKYEFLYTNKILKNELIFKIKKKFIIFNLNNFTNNYKILLKIKKNIKIKNKNIKKICNCKFSFNFN